MKTAFVIHEQDEKAGVAAGLLKAKGYAVRELSNGGEANSDEIALFGVEGGGTNFPNRWLRVSPWRIASPPEWATPTPFWVGVRHTPATAQNAQDASHRFENAVLGIARAYAAWEPKGEETLPPWCSKNHYGQVAREHEGDYQRWLTRAKEAARELLSVITPEVPTLPPEHIEIRVSLRLGEVSERTDIRSFGGPFRVLFGYKTHYPPRLHGALGGLYQEYNQEFRALVEANREWDTDYQCCLGLNGLHQNFAVQVDMKGLSQGFLDEAATMGEKELQAALRGTIYEIENSLAMYQLLERSFGIGDQHSRFRKGFRTALEQLRRRFGKKIALLAVTHQKHQAMREWEFGKKPGEALTDEEVMDLSGFDAFFGPDEFRRHLEENKGECQVLLYARTSDPVARLKDPTVVVDHPLLGDSQMRRIIKANTLTMNIDAPGMEFARRINDTKAYMPSMQMGFEIKDSSDLYSDSNGRVLLSVGFKKYLESQGVDTAKVEAGKIWLRGKPMYGHYGCYGHVRGPLTQGRWRSELRTNLRSRGPYVVQPEMKVMVISDQDNAGQEFVVIDRNFLAMIDGAPMFLGGFRSLMPLDSAETREGRNHGNQDTVWAEVL